jgi:hypothetical protein
MRDELLGLSKLVGDSLDLKHAKGVRRGSGTIW